MILKNNNFYLEDNFEIQNIIQIICNFLFKTKTKNHKDDFRKKEPQNKDIELNI